MIRHYYEHITRLEEAPDLLNALLRKGRLVQLRRDAEDSSILHFWVDEDNR